GAAYPNDVLDGVHLRRVAGDGDAPTGVPTIREDRLVHPVGVEELDALHAGRGRGPDEMPERHAGEAEVQVGNLDEGSERLPRVRAHEEPSGSAVGRLHPVLAALAGLSPHA